MLAALVLALVLAAAPWAALATWAAMPEPITPEPMTATFLISVMV
jgi:hypothetical protein